MQAIASVAIFVGLSFFCLEGCRNESIEPAFYIGRLLPLSEYPACIPDPEANSVARGVWDVSLGKKSYWVNPEIVNELPEAISENSSGDSNNIRLVGFRVQFMVPYEFQVAGQNVNNLELFEPASAVIEPGGNRVFFQGLPLGTSAIGAGLADSVPSDGFVISVKITPEGTTVQGDRNIIGPTFEFPIFVCHQCLCHLCADDLTCIETPEGYVPLISCIPGQDQPLDCQLYLEILNQ